METLQKQRGIAKGKITRANTYLSSTASQSASCNEIKRRIASLDEAWKEYDKVSTELIIHSNADEQLIHQNDYEECESKYFTTAAGLSDLLENLQGATSTANLETSAASDPFIRADIKLPRLNLPSFSGDYLEWTEFQDLFNSMVHENTQISDAQKLQYLKGVLKGDAAEVIKSVKTTNANYQEAWNLLKEHFQDTYKIKMSHVQKLCSQPVVQHETASELRQLLNTTAQQVRALKVLGTPVESWDLILVHLLTSRLDKATHREWERSRATINGDPSFEDIRKFLVNQCKILDNAPVVARNTTKTVPPKIHSRSVRVHSTSKATCPVCDKDHFIYQCEVFLGKQAHERTSIVKDKSLCYNCLKSGHSSKECKVKSTCRKCGKHHNTLLHFDQSSENVRMASSVTLNPSEDEPTTYVATHLTGQQHHRNVLLPTIQVKIQDSSGALHICRGILDCASEVSLLTESVVQRLGLKRVHVSTSIEGINGTSGGVARGAVNITVHSCVENFSIKVNALVINKISGLLPKQPVITIEQRELANYKLADPDFDKPNTVDLLIGSDYYYHVIKDKLHVLSNRLSCVQDTHFGWVVGGQVQQLTNSSNQTLASQTIVNTHLCNIDISRQIQRFWDLEEVKPQVFLTEEERECETHFTTTHTRNSDGRYVVALPFKENVIELGDSCEVATKRLLSVERRLQTCTELQNQYQSFMEEYEELNHMSKVKHDKNNNYLPHHFVIKNDSTTTKLRVVFDASCKTSSGVSFNDTLMVGPKLQPDIFDIILRFRSHRYAVSADVEKMYRQVNVREEDRRFQCILWRANPKVPIQAYQLNTVTYGTASGPYLAIRALQQVAIDEQSRYPQAAKVLKRDFYVDDVVTGEHTITSTQQLCVDLAAMLKEGGFELRKWSSNEQRVLEKIPSDLHATSMSFNIASTESVKTLGIQWNTSQDEFTYHLWKLDKSGPQPTKRNILSEVSRLYDPLGWIAPIIIHAKIIIQKLWLSGTNWDEPVSDRIKREWNEFREELPLIEEVKVPRFIIERDTNLQLHGFCDASEVAFAAAIYIRSTRSDGSINVNLLCAKTRVAPIKPTSLPRLELCAAVLLARLMHRVQECLINPINCIWAWSDSTITLAWIKSHPSRWKTFVANRVAEIQELIIPNQWHHVPTDQNPADVASRGICLTVLRDLNIWWKGPVFLEQEESTWPVFNIDISKINAEERINQKVSMMTHKSWKIVENYSSLSKVQRVIAYCLRFKNNCKTSYDQRERGFITTMELHAALIILVRHAQHEAFPELIDALKGKGQINHNYLNLDPFIDDQGCVRVGGRLQNSSLSYMKKHPLLLPKRHKLTQLVIEYYHQRLLHPGTQLLLSVLRDKFWIVNGRNTIRYYTYRCLKCFRDRATAMKHHMGNLPQFRVEANRPFLHTGIDFGGPFQIKASKGRGARTWKAYMALFICLATKAVHIEVVSDLTAEAFVAALRRFCARRGICKEIVSDNATNFCGANKELKELYDLMLRENKNQVIMDEIKKQEITWKFIPPYAPHFGGLWESNIKSAKQHLRRVVGKAILTFEELTTILTQIEACLNSRPLYPISSDPNDLSALTPGHFLIGEPLVSVPDVNLCDTESNRLSRWQLIQQIKQRFWKRWHHEYLTQLQQRHKWQQKTPNAKIGDLVIVKEDHISPLHWPMGRIIELYPGKDGVVRVVTIKTKSGITKRSITKLCISRNRLRLKVKPFKVGGMFSHVT